MESLGSLRGGLHPQQWPRVHALGVQRFSKIPVRVNRRGICFGMTKCGLAEDDVFGGFEASGELETGDLGGC